VPTQKANLCRTGE